MENNDVIDEIVNDTIEKIDDLPFGITDEELEIQEIVTDEEGENDENTIE